MKEINYRSAYPAELVQQYQVSSLYGKGHHMSEEKLVPESNVLVATLAQRIRASLAPDGPSPASVLEWLATQPDDVVKAALIRTQPKAWAVAVAPLVDSLTADQRIGMLAAFIAVWVQAQ